MERENGRPRVLVRFTVFAGSRDTKIGWRTGIFVIGWFNVDGEGRGIGRGLGLFGLFLKRSLIFCYYEILNGIRKKYSSTL